MFFERYTSSPTTTDMQGAKVPAIETTVAVWSEEDLLAFHEVPTQEEAIFRLNAAGFFTLSNKHIYREKPDGGISHYTKRNFDCLFANRRCGKRRISAGSAWKRSGRRREYDRIGYWPDNHCRPPRSYNLWQGWGIQSIPGNWSPIYDYILTVLAAGDVERANYILDFCAHIVQRPWEKPRVALVFRGLPGTLKSLLTELLAATIGRWNVATTANDWRLFEKYNWNLADKLLVGAFSAGNRELNKLKQLLINDEIEVRQKYSPVIKIRSLHRIVITLDHLQVIDASDDGCRFFVCDVWDNRRGDDPYYAPLWDAVEGKNDALLAAFMHELRTRNIAKWKPEEAARKAGSVDLARQKLQTLEPPLQWLLENVKAATRDGAPNKTDMTPGTWSLQQERGAMLRQYREWAKSTQVRGANDFGEPQRFWTSVKRLLNNEVFPGQRLFRRTAAARYVLLPTRQEMRKGFNRLLGGAPPACARVRGIPESGPITLVKRHFFQPRQRDGVF